jgi:HEAT repeat protein
VLAIGRLRYREAVPELTRLYEKESRLPKKEMDKTFHERLLEALAFIADPGSKELFVKEKQNPDDGLRLRAIEGLARIGEASLATEISRDRLHEKDPKVQTAQAYALYRMGRKEYLDELVNSLGNRRTHNEAKQYLVELRPEELPDLLAQIRNQDVDVRESLAEVLGLMGDSRAIPALQELGKDRRGQVSALATQAQRRIMARGATN